MEKNTPITKESLIAFGMKATENPAVSLEKVLAEGEDGRLSIAVTHYRNVPEISLVMPGGHMLYIGVSSIDELQAFEKCILSYEPNY
jgi:hypothetical protein